MRHILLITIGLFLLNVTCLAQKDINQNLDHKFLFKAVPLITDSTPEWARVMYSESLNFEKVERLYIDFYKENEFIKNIHTQNFKYWYKQVKDYVNDAGHVVLPQAGEEFRFFENKKRQRKQQGRMNTWSCIGPNITYNGNSTLTTRPTQANVYCLGVAPSNTSVVYAGMETGGVFKTIDKGLNWFPVSFDYAIGSLQDIKVDPLNEDIVYIARDKEVYKSVNGGTTWSLLYVSTGKLEQFFIHPTVTDTIYAATSTDLLKSNDAGITWTSIFSGRLFDVETRPGTTSTIYIAVENTTLKRPEIWKSTDAGATWTLKDNQFYVPSDLSVATVYGCKIGVSPADPNRVYAGIIATGKASDNGWIGVYHSTNGGDTWINQSGVDGASIYNSNTGEWEYPSGSDMNTNWYVGGYSSGYHQGFYNFDIDVSHTNADRLWIGTIWFCESANKGANIEYIRGTRSLEMHADIQDIDVVGNDIWVTSDGGINYSNDECQTMEVRMNGITASDFWGFGQGWNEDTWVGGRYHNGNAAYHQNYGVGNSIFLGGAESATGIIHQFHNKKTYCSDIGGREIPDSLNHNVSNIVNFGLYPNQSYYHFSYSEAEWHPHFGNIVYVGYESSFYKSEDSGNSFTKLSDLPGAIRRFEISRDDPNYIYAIVYVSYWDWRVYKSVDGGNSFTQIVTPPYSGGSWRELSISLNPFNKNEIWMASNSSSDGNKIFQSTDGGSTWVNRYGNELSGQGIKDIIYHSSLDGDILYAMTSSDFFYYDVDENSWTQYNSGLPVQHRGFKMLPFYRDEKIRMATAKGIWEAPMVNSNKVQAIPMIKQNELFCSRDTVYLESYSIVNDYNTSWNWSISPTPSYISDSTVRNPKVVLGSDGTYDITLHLTQSDGQTDIKTINNMVMLESQCEAERFPGMALHGANDADYFVAPDANLDSITHFTVTGWWKPDSLNAFSALFSSGDWCAHCDDTEALMIDYYGSRVWYKWPGNAGNWGSNSGMYIPVNEWSYVALVIEPTKATMYLNDEKYVHNISLNPGSISTFHVGRGHYSSSFYGYIDEVTVWNKALPEADIRRLRHLTKEDEIINDPDLIAYYQFNNLINDNQVLDHAGIYHGSLTGNTELITSTAPIGGGTSETFVVNSGGVISSNSTGVEMEFPSSGTYPDGEIVISRLDLQPNISPSSTPIARSYWIINNYGPNKTFSNLSSITFKDIGNVTPYNAASQFYLYERAENADDNTWATKGRGNVLDIPNKDITYNVNVKVNSFGQFTIDNTNAKGWIGVVNTDWDNPNNWGGGVVPTATSDVIIPKDTPFQPIVNVNSTIRSITIMEGASVGVLDGILFEVK